MVIRPSGTEPKLRMYVSVSARCEEKAVEIEREIDVGVERIFK